MADLLTDAEITALVSELKPLPVDYLLQVALRPKRGHKERELSITGAQNHAFQLILRESLINPLDFSVIVGYFLPQSNTVFRLRRHNGKSHEPTNKIERFRFYDFHIHQATERYQSTGLREDHFAQPTNRFQDFTGALDCMLRDCNFQLPPNPQLSLL